MSGGDAVARPAGSRRTWGPRERKQFAWITAGAVAVFVGMRFLPTGTNLNHMDFRVSGQNSIEFCDPSNPQFIPVVAVRSPVTMAVKWGAPLAAGREARGAVVLKTASEKPVEAQDLLVAHTRKLHLLIVDPSLTDYQHVHPEPGHTRGEWTFQWTPRAGGAYRVFADFTPAATGRGLYASAEAEVAGPGAVPPGSPPATTTRREGSVVELEGFQFRLVPAQRPMRAGQTADLTFSVMRSDGGAVPMEPVMGAFAHLVAFDEARSGFAHLHPAEVDLTKKPDAVRPELSFKITIPKAGRYVIWAQVNLGGRERFAPFWFQVE